jgi:DNA processing protein
MGAKDIFILGLFNSKLEVIMKYWIWLSSIPGIGPIIKKKLLDIFIEPEAIYKADINELRNISGLGDTLINNIIKSKDKELLNKYYNYINKNNIKIININDNKYPLNLKNIYDPPITLFVLGESNILNDKSIAIIGCRDATYYGTKNAEKIAYDLVKFNINIVSGLAKGIDSHAHIGAINGKGKTIAILGCGIDIIYPPENKDLYKKIIKNGAIISEYIVGTKPASGNFPARNRIISGISQGVIVVEAKKKSGSMITTDFALEQGKELYSVPGRIDSKQSEGTNELIRQGAKVYTNALDVLEDVL